MHYYRSVRSKCSCKYNRECDEDTHNVFVTYSNNRGKFLRHEEYTINLFGKKATALVVGSILAGVLVIAPEIGIPLGAKLVLGATSAGLIGASGTMPWNIRASVDVYSSPYRVGRRYTRFYGDFYTTDGEYITSLHWSKRGISLMKNVLLRALMYNIVGLFIMVGFCFLKYDINKTHTKEMLLIIFLGEVFYWLTVIIGLLIIKRLKS